jgi:hypothetical protein
MSDSSIVVLPSKGIWSARKWLILLDMFNGCPVLEERLLLKAGNGSLRDWNMSTAVPPTRANRVEQCRLTKAPMS